jgi:hypothetical protein
MQSSSRINWTLLYILAGATDFIQLMITVLAAPLSVVGIGEFMVAANEAADPVIGIIIIAWLQLHGIPILTNFKRLLSLVGAGAIEEATGGAAPFWILDIWYIHSDYKSEEAVMAAQQSQEQLLANNVRQTYYEDGVGKPRSESANQNQPLNSGGIGRARGNSRPLPDNTN